MARSFNRHGFMKFYRISAPQNDGRANPIGPIEYLLAVLNFLNIGESLAGFRSPVVLPHQNAYDRFTISVIK